MKPIPHLEEALVEVLNYPSRGRVACGRDEGFRDGDDRERLVAFLAARLQLEVKSEWLRPLSRSDAERVAAEVFRGWLVRRGEREAEVLAREFLESFEDSARFYSTFTYHCGGGQGGRPLFDNSFDSGILVADPVAVGILWFGDED